MRTKGNRPSKAVMLSALIAFASFASRDVLSAARDKNFFSASRALGMGDAYTAYDVGFESVYYNPAGVAKRGKAEVKALDLEVLAGQGIFNIVGDVWKNLDPLYPELLSNVATALSAKPGVAQDVGIAYLPQFLIRGFSIGLVARGYYEAAIDATTSNLDIYTILDMGLYAHYGLALFGGILKIGVGVKAIDRASINKSYTPDEYSASSIYKFENQYHEGIGYGYDAGILLTVPTSIQPTLGVALQDIGNTTFLDRRILFTGSSAADGAPDALPQKINVGLSINSKLSAGMKWGLSAEVKNILSTTSINDRIHAGTELILQMFTFRAGLNEGRYWTAGLALNSPGGSIELTSYGENVAFAGESRRSDRKWLGRYVITF